MLDSTCDTLADSSTFRVIQPQSEDLFAAFADGIRKMLSDVGIFLAAL